MADGTRWTTSELMGLTTMYDDTNERLVVERAERSVLASAMIEADIAAVLPTLVSVGDFASPAHALIAEAINELVATRTPIDGTTLGAVLHQRGRLITVGGLAFLTEISRDWFTSTNVEVHARIVREAARARAAGVAASKVVALVASGAPMAAIDRAAVDVPSSAAREDDQGFSSMADAVGDVLDNIDRMNADHGAVSGVTTGLVALDRQIGRLRAGQLIVIGGRPVMGKTALVQKMATAAQIEEMRVAKRENRGVHPVLFVSLEMQRGELAARDIARASGVDLTRVISGRLGQSDLNVAFAAAQRVAMSPMKVLQGSPKLSRIRALCHREKARAGGVALVVVDYIQLVPAEQRSDNREREVSETSRGLKLLAGELGCAVIALSQLNRDLERRADKRPTLADLRESGAVEQDADAVMFVYRDAVYNPNTQDRSVAELIVAKQRNGPTGTVRVGFDGGRTAFYDLAGDADDALADEPQRDTMTEAQIGGAAIYEAAGGLPDVDATEIELAARGPQYDGGDGRAA